jgi:hypothetical protein
MRRLGIALIIVAVLILPVPFVAALFGLLAVAGLGSVLYLISPILCVLGIALLVLASRQQASERATR